MRRAGRDRLGPPGFRTRELTRVAPRRDAATAGVSDLAARSRQRWPVETALAHRTTTRRREVVPGQTVPGVLQERTVVALVDHVVRLVL